MHKRFHLLHKTEEMESWRKRNLYAVCKKCFYKPFENQYWIDLNMRCRSAFDIHGHSVNNSKKNCLFVCAFYLNFVYVSVVIKAFKLPTITPTHLPIWYSDFMATMRKLSFSSYYHLLLFLYLLSIENNSSI